MKKAITIIILILGLTGGSALAQMSYRLPVRLKTAIQKEMSSKQVFLLTSQSISFHPIRSDFLPADMVVYKTVEWQSSLEPWMLDVKEMSSDARTDEWIEEPEPVLEKWMFDFSIRDEEPGLEEWMVGIKNGD